MPDFSKAREGDKVFSILNGWGFVISVEQANPSTIRVDFGVEGYCSYTLNGKRYYNDLRPDLYWDEVTLNIPESALTPPKRKVKKYAVLRMDVIVSGKPPNQKKEPAHRGFYILRDSIKDALEYMHFYPFVCKGPFEVEIEE